MSRVEIQVLHDISITARSGEVTAILGGNGSGKSTLLRLIAGLLKPSSGTIKVLGFQPTSRKIRKEISLLQENPIFHRGVSGIDYLTYLGKLRRISKPKIRAKVWLERFGINEPWQTLPTNMYSEGMRVRTGLAAAFLSDPKVLLLDEPLENLDSNMKSITISLIQEAAEDNKKIVIVAIHPDPDFEQIIKKKYIIREGSIT